MACPIKISAQHNIRFEQKSWEEILKQAKKEHKPIFVDAFTNWCGPCKKMVQDVFSDSAVALFYNSNFVNFSINIETPEGKMFDSIYQVSSFPSLLFFESSGKLISREVGYKNAPKLIALGVRAKNNPAFELFTEKMRLGYEKGTSDKHALYKYYIVLRDSGRTVDSVVAAIVKKLEPVDLKNDTAYAIWVNFDQRMDSPLLDYFFEQKLWFITNHSEDDFDRKISKIVSENLSTITASKDLVAYENLKAFIRRVYDGEEEKNVLSGVDRKFNAGK